ncbi:MAG: SDR family oxidoreductase [Bdellovibrionales bacterium]|nr:SDR family oxidoreductase [Bdellovibrionales bacterium]
MKIALVTGASRGIGHATALELVKNGYRVVVTARSFPASSDFGGIGPDQIWPIEADVTDEAAMKRVFDLVLEKWGPIHTLINNAGRVVPAPIEKLSVSEFDQTWAVNVRGAFICSKLLFAHARQSGKGGCIVNLSSLSGIRGTEKFEGFSAYVAAKHAVVGLTESLAVEGKKLGIRTNCVAPGAVDTEMLRKAVPFLKTQTRPEDIAPIIVGLCDETRSRALNGAIIEVNSNA